MLKKSWLALFLAGLAPLSVASSTAFALDWTEICIVNDMPNGNHPQYWMLASNEPGVGEGPVKAKVIPMNEAAADALAGRYSSFKHCCKAKVVAQITTHADGKDNADMGNIVQLFGLKDCVRAN